MFVTRAGLRKLERELDELDSERRAEITERLRDAREFGDGLENSELLEAREEIWRLERQISEVRSLLRQSELIAPRRRHSAEAGVGSRVVLSSDFGREEYVIVGSVEADPRARRISDESPLGRAVLGRRAGDRIDWMTPSGPSCAVLDRVI